MKIEIACPCCQRCTNTEDNIVAALKSLRMHFDITHIYDPEEIQNRGILLTPAVIINGEIKTAGMVPSVEDLEKILSHK